MSDHEQTENPEVAAAAEAQRLLEAQAAAARDYVAQAHVPEQQPLEPLDIAPQPVGNGQEQVVQFAQAMEQTAAAQPTKPVDAPRKTRAEIAAMRDEERNRSVDYWLPITQEWVKVRDLPFTDWIMLSGIPHELRDEIDAAIRDRNMQAAASGERQINSLEEAVSMMDKATNMANGVCIAAFVQPRLVLKESDLEPGNEDVWLITDLHQDERVEFMRWAQRNRAATVAANGGALASAGFPGAGMGSA